MSSNITQNVHTMSQTILLNYINFDRNTTQVVYTVIELRSSTDILLCVNILRKFCE